MKASYDGQRRWVTPLLRMATSVLPAPVATKTAAGRTEINFERMVEVGDGWAESIDAMLVMVEAQGVTRLLMIGGRL